MKCKKSKRNNLMRRRVGRTRKPTGPKCNKFSKKRRPQRIQKANLANQRIKRVNLLQTSKKKSNQNRFEVKPEPPPLPPNVHRKPSIIQPTIARDPTKGPDIPPQNIPHISNPNPERNPRRPRPRTVTKKCRNQGKSDYPDKVVDRTSNLKRKHGSSCCKPRVSFCSHCGQVLPELSVFRSSPGNKSSLSELSDEHPSSKPKSRLKREHYYIRKIDGSASSGDHSQKISRSKEYRPYMLTHFQESTITILTQSNKDDDEVSESFSE